VSDTEHVTIITPGHRAAAVRDAANSARPQTLAHGVELVGGRAWDGPLPDAAIEAAREAGAIVYVRGVDADSMSDAIEQAGYQRKEQEEVL
jgi:hypothetical protein